MLHLLETRSIVQRDVVAVHVRVLRRRRREQPLLAGGRQEDGRVGQHLHRQITYYVMTDMAYELSRSSCTTTCAVGNPGISSCHAGIMHLLDGLMHVLEKRAPGDGEATLATVPESAARPEAQAAQLTASALLLAVPHPSPRRQPPPLVSQQPLPSVPEEAKAGATQKL